LGRFLEAEEIAAIQRFLDSIPHGSIFLHGDYHTKNIMLRGGELLLIDVGDAAVGNPLFDVAQMGCNYLLLPQAIRTGNRPESLLGYSVELAEPLWRGQLAGYFGTEDDAELDRIQASLMPLGLPLEAGTTRIENLVGIRPGTALVLL
jgi:hypothetical protein